MCCTWEDMHVSGQIVYEKSLYLPLTVVNLKVFLKQSFKNCIKLNHYK